MWQRKEAQKKLKQETSELRRALGMELVYWVCLWEATI